jgi:hypothetical protein
MELDFLDGGDAPEVTTPVEVSEGPARGPDGKFTSQTAEPASEPVQEPVEASQAPESTPEPQAAQPVTPAVPAGYVPVSVLQAERERRQALEERARQYQAERTAEPAPDPYEDPEGFARFQQMQTQSLTLNVKLDLSEDISRERHGNEVVDAAREWALTKFAQSPTFQNEVLSQRNPYEFIVQQHKREQLFANVSPDELEQFRAWKANPANPLTQASPAPQPVAAVLAAPQQFVAPPRSLASAPAAGSPKPGEQPVGPGVAFDALFKG